MNARANLSTDRAVKKNGDGTLFIDFFCPSLSPLNEVHEEDWCSVNSVKLCDKPLRFRDTHTQPVTIATA
jgi:hypothetical protein